ncbi:hypothetical protein DRP77_00730 [Candidatus Poribacteria bacterium]|nr:MAG: hypothetical protein DRP77_00730 [Candidatus Poribacteria bacterium]
MHRVNFLAVPFLIDVVIALGAVVLNLFAQNLGATPFQLGLLGFSWGVSYAILTPLAGRLADRLPRKPLMGAGLAVYGASMFAYGLCSSVNQLILLGLVNGTGCAFFWPVFETYLQGGDPEETNKRSGLFNMGWTLGLIVGSALGGYSMALGPRLVLKSLALLVFITTVYLMAILKEEGAVDEATEPEPSGIIRRKKEPLKFLHTAWIANFAVCFGTAITASIFPKVCRVEGIPDGIIGLLLSVLNIAQASTFLILSRTAIWHYRLAPVFASEGLVILGLTLIALGKGIPTYIIGMLLQGIGRGVTYSSSLFYGLEASESRGANMGVHEMLLGSAFTLGPLFGGLAAQAELKSAFGLGAGVIALALPVHLRMLARRTNPIRRASG